MKLGDRTFFIWFVRCFLRNIITATKAENQIGEPSLSANSLKGKILIASATAKLILTSLGQRAAQMMNKGNFSPI